MASTDLAPATLATADPTPTPAAPVAETTPTPAAPPETAPPPALPPAPALGVSDIAKQPELWPKQVLLRASVRFPVILKGVNVGNIQVPSGSPVLLHKVNPDETVEIELRGAQTKVKAELTDLVDRVRASGAPAAPATLPAAVPQ